MRNKKLQILFFNIVLFFFTALPSSAAQAAGSQKPPTYFSYLFQPKLIVMLVLGLLAFWLLKTSKMNTKIKVPFLLFTTLLFGLVGNIGVKPFSYFLMHPSPICASVKPFLFGLRIPFLATISVIFFLTLIGPKLFCGWVCPVGAIQELIAMWADKLNIKRVKNSFTITQTIRLALFLIFIFFSVTAVFTFTSSGKVFPLNIYDYLNAFHGLELQLQATFWDNVFHFLPFLLTIILAFKFYRPFCHYVCPVGLYTHFLEQIALYRITLKKSACTDCGTCEEKSPCAAIPEILKEANLRPDCFGCNICLENCSDKALSVAIPRTME